MKDDLPLWLTALVYAAFALGLYILVRLAMYACGVEWWALTPFEKFAVVALAGIFAKA